MECYIATGTDFHARFLEKLFDPEIRQGTVHIRWSGPRSGAISTASTILSWRRKPVVLVLDAETTNQERIAEDIDYLEWTLRSVSPGVPYKVVLVIPEMERWLFETPAALERVFGRPLSQEQLIRAQFEPRRVLMELLATGPPPHEGVAFLDALTDDEICQLRNVSDVADIRQFVEEVASEKV